MIDNQRICNWLRRVTTVAVIAHGSMAWAQPPAKVASSFMPVDQMEPIAQVIARMKAEKAAIAQKHAGLLEERYNLSDIPAENASMSRGKPLQMRARAKLSKGITWEQLGALSPQQIRQGDVFPIGFLPLPHPNHPEGGMLFPKFHIDEIKKQEGRDLTRFDLDFDLPDRFLPEFPPPIFLTTRLDLGDVSQGKLVTTDNYFALFQGLLNPKQLEGLRLLVTPFMQQQFNQTDDRRSERPSRGVACFDCHANGHTNASTHLVGDIRPQEFRHRIDTPDYGSWHLADSSRWYGVGNGTRSHGCFEYRLSLCDFDNSSANSTVVSKTQGIVRSYTLHVGTAFAYG